MYEVRTGDKRKELVITIVIATVTTRVFTVILQISIVDDRCSRIELLLETINRFRSNRDFLARYNHSSFGNGQIY